jgi:Zn-dependent peptidase ImmA (M78 family)/transcriptional regulator with XRE-family HTH domain
LDNFNFYKPEPVMIGERLKRARAAAGLSMDKLGKAAGVSANMIKKYEHDESMPSSSVLMGLCDALSVKAEYFFRPNNIQLSGVEYRKKASTPKKVLERLKADVLDQAERWFELRNLWPEFPVNAFRKPDNLPVVESMDDVEAIAALVRQQWQLGVNPIPDLIDLLEAKGVLVIITGSEHADQFDGLQASVQGVPVVVTSNQWPGCRQRFTLAHELGHLILHGLLPESFSEKDEEKACHRFAAAFLLPPEGLLESIGEKRHGIEWKELYLLKHEYGLSMQAILYRCKDLAVITEEKCQAMFMEFSKNRWRSKEPGDEYPREQTRFFEQLVYRGAGEGILSDAKAAELLGISSREFRRSRMMVEAV